MAESLKIVLLMVISVYAINGQAMFQPGKRMFTYRIRPSSHTYSKEHTPVCYSYNNMCNAHNARVTFR